MQVICVVNRVICELVSAGLIPHLLESGTWRQDLIIVRGYPPLLGNKDYTVRRPQGRHRLSCREFPKARPANREVPETLWPTWVLTSGGIEVRGMLVFSPGETPGERKVGFFPRQDWRCAEDGYSPDESIYYVLDYYCINSA